MSLSTDGRDVQSHCCVRHNRDRVSLVGLSCRVTSVFDLSRKESDPLQDSLKPEERYIMLMCTNHR